MVARESPGLILDCGKNEKGWSEMAPEVLESIAYRLPLLDFLTFRNVCKPWLSASSRHSNIIHFSSSQDPWLVFYGMDDMCYLYGDSLSECWTTWSPNLRGATCVYSQFGWLLAHRNGELFIYNLFDQEKIDLPEYRHVESADQVYMFSCVPTSHTGCTVSIIRRISGSLLEMYSCGVGDAEWTMRKLNMDPAEVGLLTFARYCSFCSGSDTGCNCSFKDTIFIFDTNNLFLYELGQGRLLVVRNRSTKSKPYDRYLELSQRHEADWLRRFGKQGISIHACPLKHGSLGLPRGWLKLQAVGSAAIQVKVAWVVKPAFSGHQSRSKFMLKRYSR